MKKTNLLAASTLVISALTMGCSKHDCGLDSDADKAKYGAIAEITKGAHSCMVSSGQLIATHESKSPGDIAKSYKSKLEAKQWKVEVKDHKGKRANGKPLVGKMLTATKGDKKAGTLFYLLTDGLVEAVTSVK